MKNIKWSLLSILGLIVFTTACKQTKSIVNENPPETEKLENALLWEISGKDIPHSSYLFGTIHIIQEEDFFWPKGTVEAVEKAEKVVFEINMEELEDMSKIMGIMGQIFMKDGKTLKDLVTDEEYAMIKDHFDEMGIPIFMFERMKPMFLTVFSSGDIQMGDLESGAIKSYESELMQLGRNGNKKFGGLETIEYQLAVFDSIPYEDQADMLVESIKAGEGESDQFKEMTRIYKAQDLNAMQDMFASEEGGIEGFEDILLINRNKNWIPVMEEMMSEKSTFFAVGAGHLGGEFGVIKLLRDAGYQLKPISHTTSP